MNAQSLFLLAAMLVAGATARAAPAPGVPSYWSPESTAFARLPPGGLAVLNPHDGLFKGQTTELADNLPLYRPWVALEAARGVHWLGYVPTGYFAHGCDIDAQCQTWPRIAAQVQAYFAQFPALEGIFFDEASPADWSCDAYLVEYARLRAIVAEARPGALVAFNPGWADTCAVAAARPDETLVLFEGSRRAYVREAHAIASADRAARAAGVRAWHLVYGVPTPRRLRELFALAGTLGADLFYATDVGGNWRAGDDTWGAPPAFWKAERHLYAADPN